MKIGWVRMIRVMREGVSMTISLYCVMSGSIEVLLKLFNLLIA